jgi:hypothetical protein
MDTSDQGDFTGCKKNRSALGAVKVGDPHYERKKFDNRLPGLASPRATLVKRDGPALLLRVIRSVAPVVLIR